jgi:hypothetical protein
MKVETDLKAGSLLTDAAQEADQLISQASGFLTTAGQQAEDFTSAVTTKATALWDSLNSIF